MTLLGSEGPSEVPRAKGKSNSAPPAKPPLTTPGKSELLPFYLVHTSGA